MSVDEQVAEYMRRFTQGFITQREHPDWPVASYTGSAHWTDDDRRAVDAGRAAYLAAEQAERKWIEAHTPERRAARDEMLRRYNAGLCPNCGVHSRYVNLNCPMHGNGR